MKKLILAFLALAGICAAQPTTPVNNARLQGTSALAATAAAPNPTFTVPSGATLTIASGGSIVAASGSTVTGFGGGGGGGTWGSITGTLSNQTDLQTALNLKANLAGPTFTGTVTAPTLLATTINGNTFTTGTGVLTLGAGKTLTASNTLTFTGTDASSVNFGTGGTVLYSGGSYVSGLTGTANQITASAATGAVTLSIPSTFIAPGSIMATTGVSGTTGTFSGAGNFGAVLYPSLFGLSVGGTDGADAGSIAVFSADAGIVFKNNAATVEYGALKSFTSGVTGLVLTTSNGTRSLSLQSNAGPTTIGGAVTVSSTTASTSTTTGSGIFGGGIGVAGAINSGNTTTSTMGGTFTAAVNGNNYYQTYLPIVTSAGTSTDFRTLNVEPVLTGSVAAAALRALRLVPTVSSSNTLATLEGSVTNLLHGGSSTVTTALGHDVNAALTSTGNITNFVGYNVNTTSVSSSGDIVGDITGYAVVAGVSRAAASNFYGVNVLTPTNYAGTLSAAFRGQLAAGAGRYNLYMDGTAQNLLGGTLTISPTTSLLLGTAGSAVGNIGFRNATSGTATVGPPTGALGTFTVTLPNAASTLPIFGQQITFTGPTAARSYVLPDAAATFITNQTKADVLEAALFAADAGANDTYAITLTPAITAYVTGAHYRFKANTANTGAATININSVGAITIVKVAGGITTALATNDILAGQWVDLVYDGTNMQMQSLLGNAPVGSGTVTISGASLTDTAIVTGAGTTVVKTPSTTSTLDASGNMSLAGTLTSGTASSATGILTLTGLTSGSLKITGADAMAQIVTINLAAQTTGAATLTLPDFAGASQTFSFIGKAETLSGAKTFSGGILASGSNANNFSGGSGTFLTSTGAVTIGPGAVGITGIPTFTPPVRTSGVAPFARFITPADTGQTADTEFPGIIFGGDASAATVTRTGADGTTYALQRENRFIGPTYAFAGATTVTDVFTVSMTPPIAGTSATFTRGHTLFINDSTSAASSITGGLIVAATAGTTATSTGIGGGNINTGGTITAGGAITGTNFVGTFAGNTFTTGSSTYTGTAAQTYTFPTTSATIARTDAANVFTGTQDIVSTGVRLTGSNGSLTFLGLGTGADEDLKLDLDTTTNTATVSSTTGVTTLAMGAIGVTTTGTSSVGPLVDAVDGTTPLNNLLSAYGAGTAYAFTNTAAAIDFGTTDPSITLSNAGTYTIYAQVHLAYAAATVVAETASITVRRTNNTAADLGQTVVIDLPTSTALTHSYGTVTLPPFSVTTANTNDILTMNANVSATLGAGTINATAVGTSIVAIRRY